MNKHQKNKKVKFYKYFIQDHYCANAIEILSYQITVYYIFLDMEISKISAIN